MSRRPRSVMTRSKRSVAVAAALALAYGLAALVSGVDRVGEDHPAWGAYVPRVLAVRSLKPQAAHLFDTHQGPALVALATDYVSRAPYDGMATGLLGGGRAIMGQDAQADQAFRVAAQSGWQLPLVQWYWLNRSLQLGDGGLAAMRLDALLRRNPGLESSPVVMAPFESDPELQPYLLERMALLPDWLGFFSADVGLNISDDRMNLRADLLNRLAAQGHPIGCDAAQPITHRLVQQAHARLAMTFWRAQCPQAGQDVLADGPLRAVSNDNSNASAFRWDVLGTGDVSVDVRPGAGGNVLQVHNSSGFAMPFVRQLIVAPAGDYDLTWVARGGGTGGAPVAPTVGCGTDGAVPALAVTSLGGNRWASRVHLDEACEGHWLAFQLSATGGDTTFGPVTMRHAVQP